MIWHLSSQYVPPQSRPVPASGPSRSQRYFHDRSLCALSRGREPRSALRSAWVRRICQVLASTLGVIFTFCPRACFFAEGRTAPDHLASPVPTAPPSAQAMWMFCYARPHPWVARQFGPSQLCNCCSRVQLPPDCRAVSAYLQTLLLSSVLDSGSGPTQPRPAGFVPSFRPCGFRLPRSLRSRSPRKKKFLTLGSVGRAPSRWGVRVPDRRS